jgi:hypothetical protein
MELLTVEIPQDTRRRLEIMGFPHDLSGRDVARFLIEEGLAVLEKHRTHKNNEPSSSQRAKLRAA